jgi:hypothetical protein
MDERAGKWTVSAVALAGRSGGAAVAPAVSRQTRDQVDVVVAAHPGCGQTLVSVLRERAERDGERDGFVFLTYRGAGAPQEVRLRPMAHSLSAPRRSR